MLEGTRLDQYHRCLTGTDGRLSRATVHVQNHDPIAIARMMTA